MPTAGGPDCAQPARWVPPVALVAFVPAGTWIRPPSCRALGSPMDNVIAFVAQYFFILSIAIACLGWLRLPAGKKWALAAAGIAGGVVRPGLITLAGRLYYDPRAFAAHHLHPLFAHAARPLGSAVDCAQAADGTCIREGARLHTRSGHKPAKVTAVEMPRPPAGGR